jgi:hypothetical protein
MGLQPSDQILVKRLQPSCGQVEQKILTIEMATKIRSLFLMFQIFLYTYFFFSMATKFRSWDYNLMIEFKLRNYD